MASDKKKPIIIKANADDADGGDQGGKSGQIEFRDFAGMVPAKRDDLLPPDEKKRLAQVHNQGHESRVKKQKEKRLAREQVKEGKMSLGDYREGLSRGDQSQYKSHPLLADKAQFSGIDKEVNPNPNEQLSEANQEMRNELEYQYKLRFAPGAPAPQFNPKPQRGF